ncbi:hypothetical protein JW960_23220 [candidate division KSB1 bacterium]|nr:hypothetical protein [candidate division KSB1 bacterium]
MKKIQTLATMCAVMMFITNLCISDNLMGMHGFGRIEKPPDSIPVSDVTLFLLMPINTGFVLHRHTPNCSLRTVVYLHAFHTRSALNKLPSHTYQNEIYLNSIKI